MQAGQTVQLLDGSQIVVRPIEPGDRGALQDGLARLGAESRYRRFLAPVGRLSERELRYLTEVDHQITRRSSHWMP